MDKLAAHVVQDPDHSALEDFLRRVEPKLKRLLASYRIPIADAEDLVQDSLLKLVYRLDKVPDPELWLLGTLRRHCLMYWRGYRHRLYEAADAAILESPEQRETPPSLLSRQVLFYEYKNPVRFTYDPAKNERNVAERGFSFDLAAKFDWSSALIAEDTRQRYPERRYQALGWIDEHLHMLVFTPRDGAIHVISLRRANQRERSRYAAQT